MNRIAVTGASGFIGKYVLDELEAYELGVTAVVRSASSERTKSGNVHWKTLDVCAAAENAFTQLGCPDTLIHLAWDGLENYHALSHLEVQLPAQYSFLSHMVKSGLKNLVVAGTCYEYGLRYGPLSETDPASPITPYGFAKHVLHRQLEYLQAAHPFNLTWARLFFMHGDGQPDRTLLSQLQAAVGRGDATFPMSGGEQLLDYLPVHEVAHYLTRLALRGENIGTVNICSGIPRSVRSLVEQWIRENGWDITLELGRYPYREFESMAFWGVPEKLQRLLNGKN